MCFDRVRSPVNHLEYPDYPPAHRGGCLHLISCRYPRVASLADVGRLEALAGPSLSFDVTGEPSWVLSEPDRCCFVAFCLMIMAREQNSPASSRLLASSQVS